MGKVHFNSYFPTTTPLIEANPAAGGKSVYTGSKRARKNKSISLEWDTHVTQQIYVIDIDLRSFNISD